MRQPAANNNGNAPVNNNNAGQQPGQNVGIEEDFLAALPEDVRREVEAQGMPGAQAQN